MLSIRSVTLCSGKSISTIMLSNSSAMINIINVTLGISSVTLCIRHLPFAEANGKTLHSPMHSPQARNDLAYSKQLWSAANILFFVVKDWASLIFLNCTWFSPMVVSFSLGFGSGFLTGWNKTLNILMYTTDDAQYQYNDAHYQYLSLKKLKFWGMI